LTFVVIRALMIAVLFVPTIAQLAAKNFEAMPEALLAPNLASLILVTFGLQCLMIPQLRLPRWKIFTSLLLLFNPSLTSIRVWLAKHKILFLPLAVVAPPLLLTLPTQERLLIRMVTLSTPFFP
jgi:hypothetical protein